MVNTLTRYAGYADDIVFIIKECNRSIKKLFKTYHSFSKILILANLYAPTDHNENYFNEFKDTKAPKSWSKYTTPIALILFLLIHIWLTFQKRTLS